MHISPAAARRKLDLAVTAELALVLALLGTLAPTAWPLLLSGAAAATVLALRFRGTTLAAIGLSGLLAASVVALIALLSHRPAVLLVSSLALMQLALYRQWALPLVHGAVFAVVPHLVGISGTGPGLAGFSAYMVVQALLVAWITHERAANGRALFDVEFLVRAMGRTGRIRLDLGVVRAETTTGQRLMDVQQRVADTLVQVRQSARATTTAATTLQTAGEGLTARTQSAGRELGDAAMTLEQIAVIVKDSADAAMAARRTAQAATTLAQEVGGIVTQMEGQMQAIDAGAQRITEIIGVIDGIAFQTNLLALNAAVEAARAGEHGRGFAVVAAEVRMLAQRVTQAAGEVKGLIDESVQATAKGNTLARTAGTTMGRLIESVTRVDSTFHSLSADTHEHAAGLVAMRDTLFGMRDATQQNLGLAVQAQDIANALAARARGLDDALAGFQLPSGATDTTDPLSPPVGGAAVAGPAGALGAPGTDARHTRPPPAAAPAAAGAAAAEVDFF